MRILGVDPGTIFTGYGIIDFKNNETIQIAAGFIKLPNTKEMAPRLKMIYDELDKLIKFYKPDEFALETAFYGKNVQSALKIGYARGVSLLAAINNNIPLKEYSPREVKKSVVGNGAASKEQVQFMIKKLLGLKKKKMKYDESDALAVAVCHAFKMSSNFRRSKNWKEFIAENPDKILSGL
ncbi:crossover junction endodeoxyribonuclease RuvC [Melioribacteraceae bacterium 4301-Me]|uniref:crossover junction endodeoxyribonuclease RuvC n=1 Tax=Pyranulibacter aquaticus TaxID=3163344 RepID=UPI003599003A